MPGWRCGKACFAILAFCCSAEPGGPAAETYPVCCSSFLLLREAGRSGSGNLPGLLLWGVRTGSFEEPARDPAPTAAAPPLG